MEQRTIKFKAKRLDNGKWVEGDLNHSGDSVYVDMVKVDPSTVCQFTGLKDKNGKEIWENDYICEAEGTWQVEFYKGAFVLNMGDGDYRPLHDFYCGNDLRLKEALNVGSKFEKEEK